jgi:hypothetical protein
VTDYNQPDGEGALQVTRLSATDPLDLANQLWDLPCGIYLVQIRRDDSVRFRPLQIPSSTKPSQP